MNEQIYRVVFYRVYTESILSRLITVAGDWVSSYLALETVIRLIARRK